MNYARKRMFNRVIALALSVLMIATILPMDVFAIEINGNAVTINLDEEPFIANEEKEFSVTTTTSGDEGTLVRGYFEFADLPEGTTVELKYYEPQDGNWYPLTGAFGPETGFPLTDGATSTFSAKFSTPGSYTVTVSIKAVEDGSELCSTTKTVVVDRKASVLTTNIGEKTFVSGEAMEFTFGTTPNDDKDVMVRGYFEFSDPDAIEKLEYLETKDGNWYELAGAFGPETGFPMIEGVSTFRATFNKAGTYEVEVSMKTVADGTVLCSTKANVVVNKKASVLSSNIDEKEFAVGEAMEFTFGTTPNDDKDVMVRGYFEFSDSEAIEKLEYLETKDGNWYELTGAFGPETGFPMIEGVSTFRATFNKAANYKVTVSMKTVTDETVLCSIEKDVTVIQKVTVGVSKNEGGTITLNGTDSDELSDGLRVKAGTNVAVNVQAEEGYQISSLNLGGVLIANASGQTEFAVSNMIVDRDVQIEVTFVKVWTVSVTKSDVGGSVSLNDIDSADLGTGLVVNDGTKVSAEVKAEEGYQILSLNLGGVLIANASGQTEFTVDNIIIGRDVSIDVQFVKVWTVIVECDEETGEVQISGGEVAPGKVSAIIKNGETVTITAAPKDTTKHKVSGVKLIKTNDNGEPLSEEIIKQDSTETPLQNGYVYSADHKIEANHKFEITFALNTYDLTADVGADAEVKFEPETVEWDASSKVTVTPKDNYSITGITILTLDEGGTKIDEEVLTADDVSKDTTDYTGKIWFNIENIKADKKVVVTYDKTKEADVEITDLFNDEKAVRSKELTYVYANDEENGTAKFTTDKIGILLYDNDKEEQLIYGGNTEKTPSIKEPGKVVEIGKIELVYEAEGEMAPVAHEVVSESFPIGAVLELVFDTSSAVVFNTDTEKAGLTPEEYTDNDGDDTTTLYGGKVLEDGIEVAFDISEKTISDEHPKAYAGFKSVTYTISKGAPTEDAEVITLYDDGVKNGTILEAITENNVVVGERLHGKISVAPEDYNDCKVNVVFTITDKAGNVTTENHRVVLDIDATKPSVEISFDNNVYKSAIDDRGYYNAQRIATVTVTEREHHFDGDAWIEAIRNVIKATDVKGASLLKYTDGELDADQSHLYTIGEWEYKAGEKPDADKHKIEITFSGDANYTWEWEEKVVCADKAGNENTEPVVTEGTATAYKFTVDKTDPEGATITTVYAKTENGVPISTDWATLINKDSNKIEEIDKTVLFNVWSKEEINVLTSDFKDATSPMKKIEYCKVKVNTVEGDNSCIAKTAQELDKIKGWTTENVNVLSDEQFVVYVRITDQADNYTYMRTSGLVVDTKAPEAYNKDTTAPAVLVEPLGNPKNGIYGLEDEVKVKISAIDPTVNDTYSGLKQITYEIWTEGEMTKSETLPLYDLMSVTDDELHKLKQTKEWTITIDKEKNNSNDVNIKVSVQDNALNTTINDEGTPIKIDITPPKVYVEYDNNVVDSNHFFCAPRRAKITIKERNFDPNDLYAVINGQKIEWLTEVPIMPNTKDQKTYYDVNHPEIWTTAGDYYWYPSDEETDSKNYTDERTYTAFITYTHDGTYYFDIGSMKYNSETNEPIINDDTKQTKVFPFEDMTGNPAEYEATINNEEIFVIYKDAKTETLVQAAPRFFIIDKTRPIIYVSYDNNESMNEKYYKDVRTATITIQESNLEPNGADSGRIWYSLTATDDGQTIPYPSISHWTSNGGSHTATITYAADGHYTFDIGVRDKAGNHSDDFRERDFYIDRTAPSLEITGVADNSANAGNVVPVITYSDTNWDPAQVSITLTGANRGNVALDGAYTDIHNGRVFTFRNFAKVQSVDDIYTLTATLTDKAGNTTTEEIHFSVNRFGSTYAMSEETKALNGTYVKEPIDVVVTETNANALEDIKITLFKNNQTIELVEGEDYRIDLRGGNGNWYQYTYTVFAENFADDGVYRLTFHSKDAAGNIAENTLDTKEMEIGFGVDATKPDIVVANIESGVVYALENITVNMSINDNLLLKSIKVYLDNMEIKKWNAEEIAAIYAENGDFTFDIPGDSKSAHEVKVVTVDAAGNESVETISDFFVTTDAWVRYYNNKPLFYGSISGVCLFASLIIFLIVFLRKRKEDEE